jgi:uncharacterized protein YjeT (DUF2065 family)
MGKYQDAWSQVYGTTETSSGLSVLSIFLLVFLISLVFQINWSKVPNYLSNLKEAFLRSIGSVVDGVGILFLACISFTGIAAITIGIASLIVD